MNEVLDMGKLESGEVVLENVPFDLPELMHEITDVLAKTGGRTRNRDSAPGIRQAAASTAGGQPAARPRLLMNCAQQCHQV